MFVIIDNELEKLKFKLKYSSDIVGQSRIHIYIYIYIYIYIIYIYIYIKYIYNFKNVIYKT